MSSRTLTGLEKAAVLLHSLPAEVVDRTLRHLDPRQAGLLRSTLAKVRERPDLPEVLTRVLEEAAEALVAPDAGAPSGSNAPAPVSTPGRETASPAKVDIRLSGAVESAPIDAELRNRDPMSAIAAVPAGMLAQALQSENARTISLLMNAMDIEVAGQIYKRITPDKRKEVSRQFTNQQEVNEAMLKRVAQAVLRKCDAMPASAAAGTDETDAREKRMASLLRGLDRTERMEMITVLEETDAALATRIKDRLYQFDDILRMENISVQKLLADIDTKSLAMALSGAPDEIRGKLSSNLSRRAQDALKEEIELTGKVPSAKGTEARKTIVDAIQRLDQRGELLLIE